MVRRFLDSYSDKFLSKWLVLAIDIATVLFAYFLSFMIRFNLDFNARDIDYFQQSLPYLLVIQIGFFLVFRSFVGIIRHTGVDDAVRLIKSVISSCLLGAVLNYLDYKLVSEERFFVPYSVIIIYFFISTFALISGRLMIRIAYNKLSKSKDKIVNVIIYGAGQSGMITKASLLHDSTLNYRVIAFIDDNPGKVGKRIDGIKVYPSSILINDFIEQNQINEIILSIQNISVARKKQIIDWCLQHQISIKNVPPVSKWINGQLSTKQIQRIRIEDLLDREPIVLNNNNVRNEVRGKVVMVTGAAGSIGSEIARQLYHYNPAHILLVDQAETSLHDLVLEFGKFQDSGQVTVTFIIADVSDERRMRSVFKKFRPQLLFHAAAYKHVPMMENNPMESVKVNVFGSQLLADLAIEYEVEKFVMVSTDKAVNPTNIMGATKRVAEIYTQSLTGVSKTRFITTRFGNVLGSNGSVIPLFTKQIASGGPITITHPEITRYFMTIPEACQLVLEAGAMGNGGEIFIFDMGESVKIYDVAVKMIRLSGLEPGKDIQIKITGLRPGEKLMEELLSDSENTLPTHHPKIMIAKVREYESDWVGQHLLDLKQFLKEQDDEKIVMQLKRMVPEFISNNSPYEKLDKLRFRQENI